MTRLEALRALESCLERAEGLVDQAGLAWTSQEDCLRRLGNVKDSIRDEIYTELQGVKSDWQVGYGEISFNKD